MIGTIYAKEDVLKTCNVANLSHLILSHVVSGVTIEEEAGLKVKAVAQPSVFSETLQKSFRFDQLTHSSRDTEVRAIAEQLSSKLPLWGYDLSIS